MGMIKNIKLIPKIIELLKNIVDKLENINSNIDYSNDRIIKNINQQGRDYNINLLNIYDKIEEKGENILSNINYSLERLANGKPLDTSINEDWLKAKNNGILYMINKNIESLGYYVGVNEEGEAIIIDRPIRISLEDDKVGLKKYINYLERKGEK